MALLYISHIKQSLSKGMILRYSGWSSNLKLNSYDEFGGWLPLLASCCWLRGIIIFVLNIYCTRSLMLIRRKIRRREIKRKYENERYRAIPDARPIHSALNAMVYREGELEPRIF
ncbi:unnamed protein product [Arctia plantaginis]|uniref:Uncharacterized protein n=1 Tax=Arctia plantaginis TaxID=874455 RepID=A0A8S1AYW7_ARCPL|nr:unnamed protein product [Arctia plantaginis]CAB3255029.1 unnamed protein product [Arctia plantaginis]